MALAIEVKSFHNILWLIQSNDLPLSSTFFLLVNKSSHPKEKGVFGRDITKDDFVVSYPNA
jgi:hypothetical protein